MKQFFEVTRLGTKGITIASHYLEQILNINATGNDRFNVSEITNSKKPCFSCVQENQCYETKYVCDKLNNWLTTHDCYQCEPLKAEIERLSIENKNLINTLKLVSSNMCSNNGVQIYTRGSK